MKILFLGLLYNMADEKELLEKSNAGLQAAANSYQWNLIQGLDSVNEDSIEIYNFLPIGTFPKYYRQLFLFTKKWFHHKDSQDLEMGFISFPIIKELSRYYQAKKYLKKWCFENKDEDTFIIAYSLYLPFIFALLKASKKYKSMKSCLIVTDLPNKYGFKTNVGFLVKKIKVFTGRVKMSYANKIDSFILVTSEMQYPLKIGIKPYRVIEGIFNEKSEYISRSRSKENIILYSGTINKVFGIEMLINAFMEIEDNSLKLWICGKGDFEDKVIEAVSRDSRISYFGYLTQSEVTDLRIKAALLINPRPNVGEYTKYSFPSKTIEYMTSGRPVLMFKLDGIEEEYDQYLYYIKNNTVEDIKNSIIEIFKKPKSELEEKALLSYEFIKTMKSSNSQATKVLELYNDIEIFKTK